MKYYTELTRLQLLVIDLRFETALAVVIQGNTLEKLIAPDGSIAKLIVSYDTNSLLQLPPNNWSYACAAQENNLIIVTSEPDEITLINL